MVLLAHGGFGILGALALFVYMRLRLRKRKARKRLVAASLSIINDYRERLAAIALIDPRERRRFMLPGQSQEYYVGLMNELIDATKDVN